MHSSERVWKHLSTLSGVIQRLQVVSSPVLAPGSVEFGRVTALTGVHGAGKSYLLAAVVAGLPGWKVNLNLPIESSGNVAEFRGHYLITLNREGEASEVEFTRPLGWEDRQKYDADLEPLVATLLTPFAALSELAYFSQNWMPQRPLVPTDVVQLSRTRVEALRAITGRAYDAVQYGVYETSDQHFPYFRIVLQDDERGVWTMSASEFWVHYVLWHLATATEEEIVLIDEPETFLAQPGHQAFLDEIARLALERGCQVILATHAESMIRRMPPSVVRLVSSTAGGAAVTGITSAEPLLRALGRIRNSVETIVFVEDQLGAQVLRHVVLRYAPGSIDTLDIVDSGGKDEVKTGVRLLKRSGRLGVLGILDGDQRRDHDGDPSLLYLPGDRAPEQHLLKALADNVADSACRVGVSESDLRAALDAARFVPHQRVFDVISGTLGSTTSAHVIAAALAVWLEQEEPAAEARWLIERILVVAGRSGQLTNS